jgi:aminoglycoside 6'-N-acetyltransferase
VGVRLRGRLTSLRPAAASDADLLARWHSDPDVARFWDGKTYTPAEIVMRLARAGVDAWIIELDDRPVGYLQVWSDAPGTGGLDMFLEPAARGRGLGPDAARTVARSLLERGWTRVTVDPYLWNESAIRAWRRAGFVDVEERPPDPGHTHAWLLMEFRNAPARGGADAGQ